MGEFTYPEVILVAEDEPDTRTYIQHVLQSAGFHVELVADGEMAMARMADDVLVALVDLMMPKASGLDCLQYARKNYPDIPIIMMSAVSTIDEAVHAMREGAFHYINKPFQRDDLLAHLRQAIRSVQLARDNRMLRHAISLPFQAMSMVGHSGLIATLREQLSRVAFLDETVLITGESGTGKTTVARLIHQAGPRANEPFVAVSCASMPRDLIEAELFGHERGAFTGAVATRLGRAEMADKGTLFLDEIGDMPLELQPKLLTFLEDHLVQRIGGKSPRHVNVRVIAATHQDLPALCAQRLFREDLYYRLNVLPLPVPSLGERKKDIPLLANDILARIAERRHVSPLRMSDDAVQMLCAHDWPGNIRELSNVLARASAFCQGASIQAGDLEFLSSTRKFYEAAQVALSPARQTLKDLECQAVRDALQACSGNKAAAARQLGISEKTIHNMIKRFGLNEHP
ncbi:MAG: sigma-54 dependent transcriptional regulator [Nitrospira sp.]|nr:sigma-54 dependent transcriptional regulator [Nitrospira sp.]